MRTDQRLWRTYTGTLALTLAGSALYLAVAGSGDEHIRLLLRLTARLALIALLVVFVARPLRQIVRTPLTLALLRYRPLAGLAFAGIHTGHLLLILYRAWQVPAFDFHIAEHTVGGIAYIVMFAMVITTFHGPARLIGPRAWRILHKSGLYLLTAIFAQTQLPESLATISTMNWPLVVLLLLALVIRLTAFLAIRTNHSQHSSN